MSTMKVASRRPGKVRPPLLRAPVRGQSDLPVHLTMVRDYLKQLGTARALAVWMIYESGDHVDLLQLPTVDFDGICSAVLLSGGTDSSAVDQARRDYAATKLLSCADFLDLPIDREAVALKSGARAEQLNSDTNVRLRSLRSGLIRDDEFNSILHRAAQLIAKVLGPLSNALHSMSDIGWTPGRTTSAPSAKRSSPEKYQANLDITGAALRYGIPFVGSSALWSQSALQADGPCHVLPRAFNVVNHNVAITVPKNAKTDRLICYEPHVNVRLQRSVGVFIRNRLSRHAGINLSDQSVNQRLALSGSLDGWLATMDLSMASDTLCIELVRDLLPGDWFEFLNDLRARHTLWPSGQIIRNEKFSSMGNGFTFELETLVFWALCATVSQYGWATAYGDDIVVFQIDYALCASALNQAGFVVNQDKSFHDGFFRESCGKDYYRGVDVTPVYLDHRIDTVERFILFHNSVRAFSGREVQPHVSWSRLCRRWRKTIKPDVPPGPPKHCEVPEGPSGYGDGHFHVNFEEALPDRHPHGWCGWEFDSVLKVFPDRLVSDQLQDGRVIYTRLSSHIVGSNPSSMLAASLGPKKPESVYDLLKDHTFLTSKRSRLFCHAEWPTITYSP